MLYIIWNHAFATEFNREVSSVVFAEGVVADHLSQIEFTLVLVFSFYSNKKNGVSLF